MANEKNPKVRDLKPTKDAKGGGGVHEAGKNPPTHGASGKQPPAHESGKHGPFGQQ